MRSWKSSPPNQMMSDRLLRLRPRTRPFVMTSRDSPNGIAVFGSTVPFFSQLRVLAVTLDEERTFDYHISGIVRVCNYYLRALRHIRPFVDLDTANTITCSLICTRLDHCNAILYWVTKQNIGRFQRVQSSLALVVCLWPYKSSASRLVRTGSHCRNE